MLYIVCINVVFQTLLAASIWRPSMRRGKGRWSGQKYIQVDHYVDMIIFLLSGDRTEAARFMQLYDIAANKERNFFYLVEQARIKRINTGRWFSAAAKTFLWHKTQNGHLI